MAQIAPIFADILPDSVEVGPNLPKLAQAISVESRTHLAEHGPDLVDAGQLWVMFDPFLVDLG